MISIFTPSTKVHMQRDVMRKTDEQLVKYSKRGVFLNILIFSLVITVGDYYNKTPKMTFILGLGLVLITLMRGFFLFKFEQLYAKGPAKWRNLFFFFSLIGASWWGFIVAEITYVTGLNREAPLLWLYSIAFFAGSIYTFAPFERFLKLYMFLALMPCALVALFLFQPVSLLYGLIMISMYFLLCKQGEVIGKNYWEKWQATYDLLKRANTLEAEKITTQSSLDNQDFLFRNVVRELKSSSQEILSGLQLLKSSNLKEEESNIAALAEQKTQQQVNLLKNISELPDLLGKNLAMEKHTLDIRFHIEQALATVSLIAHKKNIELYSSFSSEISTRVQGDAERIEQLIGNLISSACHFSDAGELLVSSEFTEIRGNSYLDISVINPEPIKTPEAIAQINAAFSSQAAIDLSLSLNFAIIKGISTAMGGKAYAEYTPNDSLIISSRIQLPIISDVASSQKDLKKLDDKTILLYQAPKAISKTFRATLEKFGLNVIFCDTREKLLESLNNHAADLVIFYSRLDDLSSLAMSKELADNKEYNLLPQLFLLSQLQNKLPEVKEHFLQYAHIETLYKPIQHRSLQKILKKLLINKKSYERVSIENDDLLFNKSILLFQQEEIDCVIIQAMLKELGCQVTLSNSPKKAIELLNQTSFDVFICESHVENINMKTFINECREAGIKDREDNYVPPILGLSNHEKDNEETQCLACGMEYYIDSPVNIDDLQAVLKRFIGRAIHMASQE